MVTFETLVQVAVPSIKTPDILEPVLVARKSIELTLAKFGFA
jgi:hypothetical protein